MTNALGGGRDFAHLMDHLGPAMQVWLDDMQKHKFKFESQQVDTVKQRVNEWVSKVDLAEVEENRDTSLQDLVRSRAEKQQSKVSKA
jgi:3-hydroxyacyl-CoA dehydrogenase